MRNGRQAAILEGVAQVAEPGAPDWQSVAVWRLPKEFRQCFACQTAAAASEFVQNWQPCGKALGKAALQKLARRFASQWAGFVTDLTQRVSQALAESRNRQLQRLNANAQGLHDASDCRRTIWLHLGQLDLSPQDLR